VVVASLQKTSNWAATVSLAQVMVIVKHISSPIAHLPVTGVCPATVRAFMLLAATVAEVPVSMPPLMHEVVALQLLTVAPKQQACVCDNVLKPVLPSMFLLVGTVYVPVLGHHLSVTLLAQAYYYARVVVAEAQTTSFWSALVSALQSTTMTRQ